MSSSQVTNSTIFQEGLAATTHQWYTMTLSHRDFTNGNRYAHVILDHMYGHIIQYIYIYIHMYIYIYLYVYLQRCTDICMWVRLSKHMYVIFNSIYIDMFLCRLLFFCTYHGMQATIRPKRGHMLHLPGTIRQLGLSVNCSQHRSTRSTGSPQGKMTYPAW